MGEIVDKAEQVVREQQALDTMHERLEKETAGASSAREALLASHVEGAEALLHRDVEFARLTAMIDRLRLAKRSLCFGRTDDADGASLHIGRIGLRSESGEQLLVDWRAEAARPFYAATTAVPMGLRRRRHLRVDDRSVVDVTDEILDGTAPTDTDVVGDGPLVSALAGARTGRMREAAATLQREQDDIVRSDHRGIMVVEGGPGTGKTIVALHRAAYVLYAFASIAERGVLVFGPNSRFLAYISDVLPSLGENDVDLAAAADLVGIEATRIDTDPIARAKGTRLFAEALALRVEAARPHGVPLRIDTAHGSVVLDSARVDGARRSALQGGAGHNHARAAFLEYIVDELVNDLELQTAQELSEFEDELRDVLGIDLDRMFSGHSDVAADGHRSSADKMDIDWDLIREDLLGDAGIDRIIETVWPRLLAADVTRDLLRDRTALAQALPDAAEDVVSAIALSAQSDWSIADLAILDEARALIDGPPEETYGHIVVDEAQQLSEMQWRMLMRRCPSRSMTVVGDLAQAGPTTTIDSWTDALESFAADDVVLHTLTINYRTTAEILGATEPLLARIAPNQRISRSIRHGEQPIVVAVVGDEVDTTLENLIAQLREQDAAGLIGVVAAAQRASDLRIAAPTNSVTVVPAPDARGLEFDTVIVIAPDEIQHASEAGLRDLYVAQTRATKRLITLDVEPQPGRLGQPGRP